MRFGFGLPHSGPSAGADTLIAVAERAEAIGYDTLWTVDRLLYPVRPSVKYPASADGQLPSPSKRVLDPLDSLSFVAARTQRIGLGTSVLILPLYAPALLARRLTTIDVLSNGRLRLGVGTGWMPEEYAAAQVPMAERGARADEALALLKAWWTTNPVAFSGRFGSVAASQVDLRPVQQPHPPIYIAAYTAKAMRRVAREADGWMPAGVPLDGMRAMLAAIREQAAAFGRDPARLELVVRANLHIVDQPLATDRPIFAGDLAQIRADLAACRDLGAAEVLLDVAYTSQVRSTANVLEWAERLYALAQTI